MSRREELDELGELRELEDDGCDCDATCDELCDCECHELVDADYDDAA